MSNDHPSHGDKPSMTRYVSQDTPPCKGWGLLLSHRFVYAEQVDAFVCKSCGWVPGFVPVEAYDMSEHGVPTMEVEVPPDTKPPLCGDVHPEVSSITCTKVGPHSGVHRDGDICWYDGKPLVQLKVLLDTESARQFKEAADAKGLGVNSAIHQALALWEHLEIARKVKGHRVGVLIPKKTSGYDFREVEW